MRKFSLQTKTMLLASVTTLAVMFATLMLISVQVVRLVREEQVRRARWQATNLARSLHNSRYEADMPELRHTINVTRNGREGVVGVRIWERKGSGFVELVSADGSVPAEELDANDTKQLMGGVVVTRNSDKFSGPEDSLEHVYAPINVNGEIKGAVEIIERLDDLSMVALGYVRKSLWLALIAIWLITLSTWWLFRRFVHRPVSKLLEGMQRARGGELNVVVPESAGDEIGLLTREFNRMLGKIREMTLELEAQHDTLRDKVDEATAELQNRNGQLALANQELWDTSRRLSQMERLAAAGQTAAQFAHEVGTPLNSIGIHLELLRNELKELGLSLRRTDIIAGQFDRIGGIVHDMLDRTKTEKAELARLCLSGIIEQVRDATGPLVETHGVELQTDVAVDLFPIAGNPLHLQQILFNLINNSLDAMPVGGVLKINARNGADGFVQLEVVDTGRGMDYETRKHIFDPLFSRRIKGNGTGLGLVVVRQILEEHGARFNVESVPGEGTTFRMEFPSYQTERAMAAEGRAE